MVDLVAELERVAAGLRAASVPFAVCGGLAVVMHGYVRATKDIDLLVPGAHRERALACLDSLGFDLRAHPMTFGAGTPAERHVQRVSRGAGDALVTVDLLFVEPAFVDVWADRQRFEREGAVLEVVSRRGLIAMKRLAARPQDLADVAALEGGAGD
jgi:hypothetical protein